MSAPSNLSGTCFILSPKDSYHLGIARSAAGTVSLILCLLALITILCLRAFQTYPQRLFLYLAVVTVVQCPAFVLQPLAVKYNTTHSYQPLCSIVGVYYQYACWLQNFVVLWITIYLFRVIVMRHTMRTKLIEGLLIVFFLVLSIPPALIPLIGNKYGFSVAWCSIVSKNCTETDSLGVVYLYVLWLGPTMAEVAIISLAVASVVVILCSRGYVYNRRYVALKREYRKVLVDCIPLLIFPVVFNIIMCFELVNYTVSLHATPVYGLFMITAIGAPLRGGLMVWSYLLWLAIRHQYKKKLKEHNGRANTRILNGEADASVRFISSVVQTDYGSTS